VKLWSPKSDLTDNAQKDPDNWVSGDAACAKEQRLFGSIGICLAESQAASPHQSSKLQFGIALSTRSLSRVGTHLEVMGLPVFKYRRQAYASDWLPRSDRRLSHAQPLASCAGATCATQMLTSSDRWTLAQGRLDPEIGTAIRAAVLGLNIRKFQAFGIDRCELYTST
jgi:hypothetical protein